MKVDKSVINLINRRNVLDMVRLNGPVSKSELSQMTSLSLPTVMKIIEEFKASGVVLESGKGVSTAENRPRSWNSTIGQEIFLVWISMNTALM